MQKKKRVTLVIMLLLLLVLAPISVLARGGGGSLAKGTRILTPKGAVAIEAVKVGDEILGISRDGLSVPTYVERVFLARSPVLRVETDRGVLFPTEEHLVGLWKGGFRPAGELQPGNRVLQLIDGRLAASRVRSVVRVEKEGLVFNMQVGDPRTFLAETVVVHNKLGGCFPPGTPIRTVRSQTPIQKLSGGDTVLSLDPEGRVVTTRVESLYATRSQLLVVETDRGPLRTTVDHPLGLPTGGFLPAGELHPGQHLLMWDGSRLCTGKVFGVLLKDQEQEVYNLSVEWPNTFLAADFLAHNKGGSPSLSRSGFGRSRSGSEWISRSSGASVAGFISFVFMAGMLALIIVARHARRERT